MSDLETWQGCPVWFISPVDIYATYSQCKLDKTGDPCRLILKVDVDKAYADLKAENEQLRNLLCTCKAAMTYAYEDRVDQYYLNVKAEIEKALEQK